MLCSKCLKKIPPSKEVKLKDDSIVCNKCAERIQKEYHKERYKKYLNGEISYDELDPEGGRPINTDFLEIPCVHCNKSIAEYTEKEGFAKSSTVFYDKCKDRTCPDCGKVRQEGHIEMRVYKDGFLGFKIECPRCQKQVGYDLNGVCWNCFWEREAKKNCVCINARGKFWRYYCPLCEKIHLLNFRCGKCAKLIKEGSTIPLDKKLVRPWKIIVPSVFGGVVLGAIITYLVARRGLLKRKNQRKTLAF